MEYNKYTFEELKEKIYEYFLLKNEIRNIRIFNLEKTEIAKCNELKNKIKIKQKDLQFQKEQLPFEINNEFFCFIRERCSHEILRSTVNEFFLECLNILFCAVLYLNSHERIDLLGREMVIIKDTILNTITEQASPKEIFKLLQENKIPFGSTYSEQQKWLGKIYEKYGEEIFKRSSDLITYREYCLKFCRFVDENKLKIFVKRVLALDEKDVDQGWLRKLCIDDLFNKRFLNLGESEKDIIDSIKLAEKLSKNK